MRLPSFPMLAAVSGMAIIITALPVGAQTCFGGLSNARTTQAIGATASAAGAQRVMAGNYSLFTDHFAVGARFGVGSSSFSTSNTSFMGASIAVAPSGSRARQLQWCPYAQVNHEKTSYGFGLLRSSAGLAIGRDFQAGRSLTLVPFAQSALVHVRQGAPGSATNHALGELGVGVGIRLGDRLAITPSMRAFTGSARPPLREPVYSLGFQFGVSR